LRHWKRAICEIGRVLHPSTFASGDDVEQMLGIPALATIPQMRAEDRTDAPQHPPPRAGADLNSNKAG